MHILSGTALAEAIENARKAVDVGDHQQAAEWYEHAIMDPTALPALRSQLKLEHVGRLLHSSQPGYVEIAITQARRYLEDSESQHDRSGAAQLTVLLAEALASLDARAQFQSTLVRLSAEIANEADASAVLGDVFPHYLRLLGLAAYQQARFADARDYLQRALNEFERRKEDHACKILQEDLQRVALQDGDRQVIAQLAATPPDRIETLSHALLVARALRRHGQYEQAIQILKGWQASARVERPQYFNLLFEIALLSHRLGNRRLGSTEHAALEKAARESFDPDESRAALKRLKLLEMGGLSVTEEEGFSARLYDARILILQHKLEEAEHILQTIHLQRTTPPQEAFWLIAVAELSFVRGLDAIQYASTAMAAHGHEGLDLLRKALDICQTLQLMELPGYILRLAGHINAYLLRDHVAARDHWAKSNAYENFITSQQRSDEARVRYRESVPTQHDEVIMITADQAEAAAAESGSIRGEHIASVIVAIETARSQTLLQLVKQPRGAHALPLPEHPRACWDWYMDLASELPDDMALWLLHATPDRVYHGIVCRTSLAWLDFPVSKHELGNRIAELCEIWASEADLQVSTHNQPGLMPKLLSQISTTLHVQDVIERIGNLPKKVNRLVIIAGEDLAEIPFAALPIRPHEAGSFLITEFAISYLPCASAFLPLARRAQTSRGDYALIVQPPTHELFVDVRVYDRPRTRILNGPEATLENLSKILSKTPFPVVRFDCHGVFDPDSPAESFLRLAHSDINDGRLTRNHLQPEMPQQPKIPFHKCGTVIMGACDTAMFERIHREERLGLIRSALAAGASAVLAARWKAEDITTNFILRRLQGNLRYLPRDIALQKAQLEILRDRSPDIHRPHPKTGRVIAKPTHPSRWACFVLYGDAGLQTNAGWWFRQIRSWQASRDIQKK